VGLLNRLMMMKLKYLMRSGALNNFVFYRRRGGQMVKSINKVVIVIALFRVNQLLRAKRKGSRLKL
jgi:hypothetical protein